MLAKCSFCGVAKESRGLLAPDSENPLADSGARICRDCAELGVNALGEAPDESDFSFDEVTSEHERPEAQQLVSWTPFHFDGLDLEWSASRGTTYARRALHLVTLRSPDALAIRMLFPTEPMPSDVSMALRSQGRSQSDADAKESNWTCEAVELVEARPHVLVSVRLRGDAGSAVGVDLGGSWKRTPTQKDAEAAAQIAWRQLSQPR